MSLKPAAAEAPLVRKAIAKVRRDADGRLQELVAGAAEGPAESLLHVEIDRQADHEGLLDELEAELHRVLADVRAAVEDWPAIRRRVHEIVAELDERPP